MPKQIKKEQIKKSELLYRKWSVAGACGSGCVHGVYGWAYEHDSENRGSKSANDSAFCGVHYLHGSVGGMCGA